jgi:hypothetical protein
LKTLKKGYLSKCDKAYEHQVEVMRRFNGKRLATLPSRNGSPGRVLIFKKNFLLNYLDVPSLQSPRSKNRIRSSRRVLVSLEI